MLSGKIGGGDDGGIDGFFTFINNGFLDEDTNIDAAKKNPLIERFLLQSKRSPSFSETAVNQIITTAMDIFNLEKDVSVLQKHYNTELIDKVNIFREAYLKLAFRHPVLKVNYIYANKGDTANINKKVHNKANVLKETICQYFTGATAGVEFIGARELIDASRLEKSYTYNLNLLRITFQEAKIITLY